MKTSMMTFCAALALCAAFYTAPAHAEDETIEVVAGVSDAYIPSGFDSNSDAFVVIGGMFPNTCYDWKQSAVTHINATEHEVRAIAKVRQGICLMMLVPYSHEVQLGKMQTGTHVLRFMNGDGTYFEKEMNIE